MLKKSFLLLLILSLLSGCVAMIAAGTAAGFIVYDRRSLPMIERDLRIFHLIHKRIIRDPMFRESRVLVSSFNQVVLLVGQTPRADLKAQAHQIALQTEGVLKVYDGLSINYPIPLLQRTEDSWITSQARTLLLAEKGLESGSIRLVTEDGKLYLMGIVTKQQGDLAANVVRRIPGVKKVIKIFQYII